MPNQSFAAWELIEGLLLRHEEARIMMWWRLRANIWWSCDTADAQVGKRGGEDLDDRELGQGRRQPRPEVRIGLSFSKSPSSCSYSPTGLFDVWRPAVGLVLHVNSTEQALWKQSKIRPNLAHSHACVGSHCAPEAMLGLAKTTTVKIKSPHPEFRSVPFHAPIIDDISPVLCCCTTLWSILIRSLRFLPSGL